MTPVKRRSRKIPIGTLFIGGDAPILIQSMCSTKTTDVDATVRLIEELIEAGAGMVRVAVDSENDVRALAEIRRQTNALLSIDLQENFRLAEKVAPFVQKIRYNPGHLHHAEPNLSWQNKVCYLANIARDYNLTLRIGVNCGSIAPDWSDSSRMGPPTAAQPPDPLIISALEHADHLDSIGFERYCVSIKDSHPTKVVEANRYFASMRPDVPLHLGVTEAGLPPWGVMKSRCAMEPLLAEGIGDTLRVSLTVPTDRKTEEVLAGLQIVEHVRQGTIIDPSVVTFPRLDIVSCPSCSRVQNEAFVDLAEKVQEVTLFAKDFPLTIAVMGCRVNGPGETDSADIGLWCGLDYVHLKEGTISRGSWKYDEIIEKMLELLKQKIQLRERR